MALGRKEAGGTLLFPKSIPIWRVLFQMLASVIQETQLFALSPDPSLLCYTEAIGILLLESSVVFYLWCGYLLVS